MDKRILVTLDGSKLSEMVLPHAVSFARANGYGLTLLRVAQSPSMLESARWNGAHNNSAVEESDDGLYLATEYLEMVAERLETVGLDIQTKMLEGEAPLSIVGYAERHPEVALVAMSTHGRSGLSRLVFGSVAERVLHDSPVPLLLVRPEGEPLPADFAMPAYKSLLVPLDGSDFASQALDIAVRLAAALHAKVTLVSSVPDPRLNDVIVTPLVVPAEWNSETEMLLGYLQQSRAKLEAEDIAVETVLEYGQPSEAILRVAEAITPDLIVMATHGRVGLPRLWLGSIAMKVVHSSHCPVLLVHAKERIEEKEHAPVRLGSIVPTAPAY